MKINCQFLTLGEVKSLNRVWLFVTPWTVAHQAPLSMGFSRQEYWNWLPFPSPGGLPNPGIKPRSPTLQAEALTSEPPGKPCTYVLVSRFSLKNRNIWPQRTPFCMELGRICPLRVDDVLCSSLSQVLSLHCCPSPACTYSIYVCDAFAVHCVTFAVHDLWVLKVLFFAVLDHLKMVVHSELDYVY